MMAVAAVAPVAPVAPTAPVAHLLHPGGVAVASRGERLQTLLGSCVAVLLADPRRTVGALCHVVNGGRAVAGAGLRTAFGDDALEEMFAQLRQRGIEPRLCQAWVFGGGHLFPGCAGLDSVAGHVGAANVRWALRALQSHGIALRGSEFGGYAWRRLCWTVGPGEPEVRATPVDAVGAGA